MQRTSLKYYSAPQKVQAGKWMNEPELHVPTWMNFMKSTKPKKKRKEKKQLLKTAYSSIPSIHTWRCIRKASISGNTCICIKSMKKSRAWKTASGEQRSSPGHGDRGKMKGDPPGPESCPLWREVQVCGRLTGVFSELHLSGVVHSLNEMAS